MSYSATTKPEEFDRETFKTWLLDHLANSTYDVIVEFVKKDGERREMTCTRSLDRIPSEKHPKSTNADKLETSIPAFDVNKGEWRSFVVDNVRSVKFALC